MAAEKRIFYPGDKCIYFKFYTGVKTADNILVNYIHPVVKKLEREEKIEKWFFIRYNDPGFHLRFRIWAKEYEYIGYIINTIFNKFKKLYSNSLIYNTEISTYKREIERYGKKHIDLSEQLFCADSDCIVSLVSHLSKKDENYRWMLALRLIDKFFDDINFRMENRLTYIEKMSEGYRMEFGYNMYNAKQLNDIYRNRKPAITTALDKATEDEVIKKADAIIKKRSRRNIKLLEGTGIPESNLQSYIHMMMNRLFRDKNRIHELLIYDFLTRYYKSEIAKLKKNK